MTAKGRCFTGVLMLLLGASAVMAGASPEDPCRRVRETFKDGIWYFEQRDWENVLTHMHDAMITAPECDDPEKLSSFVPYGRWVYDFTPGVYMGLSLAHMAGCDDESMEHSACRITVKRWWQQIESEGQACLGRSEASCTADEGSGRFKCGPSVDWWQSLVASGAPVAPETLARYEEDCQGLRGMMSLLRKFFGGRDENRLMCNQLVQELESVLGMCPDVALPTEWVSATKKTR